MRSGYSIVVVVGLCEMIGGLMLEADEEVWSELERLSGTEGASSSDGVVLTGVVSMLKAGLVSLGGAFGCLKTLLSDSSALFSFLMSFLDVFVVFEGEVLVGAWCDCASSSCTLSRVLGGSGWLW